VTSEGDSQQQVTCPERKRRTVIAARSTVEVLREWGLKWNQALDTGGVLVANTVRVEVRWRSGAWRRCVLR